eukprot:scaffold18439_cov40-Cyclotella_meneghiniana.AAC.1
MKKFSSNAIDTVSVLVGPLSTLDRIIAPDTVFDGEFDTAIGIAVEKMVDLLSLLTFATMVLNLLLAPN